MTSIDPRKFYTKALEKLDSTWTRQQYANGITAIHLPGFDANHFYVGVMIRTGTRMESMEQMGISHFLEHMMFRGSRRHPTFFALAAAFEDLGGEWNAETGHEHTEYWYTGIQHNAAEAIDLFADFIFHPQLADMETERKVIIREIEGDLNEFGHSTDSDLHIAELTWPGSSLAFPITGTPESVEGISLADLQAYRRATYFPSNMAVCAVGGDATDILPRLEAAFGRETLGDAGASASQPRLAFPAFKLFQGPAVRWIEDGDNEYDIHLSFACSGEWSEDIHTYEMIVRILSDGFSSRLHARLREVLGLVYDISASNTLNSETGTLNIHASVLASNLDVFLEELFAVLRSLLDSGPTTKEMERAKTRAIVELELSTENPEHFGSALCWATLSERPYSLVEAREKIMRVDHDRVLRVAREVFRKQRAALVAIGPQTDRIEKRLLQAVEKGLSS